MAAANGAKPHIGDGWLRLMQFDMAPKTPVVHVRTYSTYYQTFSGDLPEYAKWYKPIEQPSMSDEQFSAADDFVIELKDFHERFDRQGKVK